MGIENSAATKTQHFACDDAPCINVIVNAASMATNPPIHTEWTRIQPMSRNVVRANNVMVILPSPDHLEVHGSLRFRPLKSFVLAKLALPNGSPNLQMPD